MKSQLAISAAEASARHPDGADSSSRHRKERKEQSISRRKQVDRASLGLHSLLATGEVSPIGVSAPDLAMQAAVALSASHHAWSGSARWCLEEQHLVRQAVDALRGTVNSNVEGAAKTQVRLRGHALFDA